MKHKKVLTELTANEILIKAGLDLNQDNEKLMEISKEIFNKFGVNNEQVRNGRVSLSLSNVHSHNKIEHTISITHNQETTICETWEDAFGDIGFTFEGNPYYLFQLTSH